jgi:hypothetical protein
MRDPQVIAREIDRARHSLEHSLGELKELVRDKLDIKQRVRRAIDRRVHDTGVALQRVEATALRHPAVTAIAACAVLALLLFHARWRRS